MYHLPHLHSKLFLLAHEMVERGPENPVSWYAVGVWYLAGGKWGPAQQYFRCIHDAYANEITYRSLDSEQQNIAHGPAIRARVGRVRAHLCTREGARSCHHSIFYLRANVHWVSLWCYPLPEWQFIQGLAYPSQLRSTPIASAPKLSHLLLPARNRGKALRQNSSV